MSIKKVTSSYILTRRSTIHRLGVFAKKDMPRGTRIIEYIGEKISKKKAERRADIPLEKHKKNKENGAVYLFVLNKKYDIDGNVSYNTARRINHSCEPNCETEIIRGKIWVIALRDIQKGEELAYNYNYDWKDYEEHKCFCGKPKCVGFILADNHWWRLKRKKPALKK